MTGSPWELARTDRADELAFQLKAAGAADFQREYRFHPERRWRIDIAYVAEKLAIEVDGGIYIGGRHVRGEGITADCEKASALAIGGWRLIRVTPKQVRTGLALTWILQALGTEHAQLAHGSESFV